MKQIKQILFMMVFMACTYSMYAQAPSGINYQAVARSSSGVVMSNKTIGVRISILAGSASGSADYVEKHSVSTNQFGLFNLIIGGGTAQTGTFSSINWGGGSKFLKLEVDTNNGSSYTTLSSTQMMSVPYALYAEKSGSGSSSGVSGSGTTNYVSKFTGSTAIGNSSIYDNGTSVAIGTTSPNANNKFTVTSSGTIAGLFENTNGSNSSVGLQGLFTNSGQYDATGVLGKSRPQDSYGIGGSFEGGWIGSVSQVLNANDSNYYGSWSRVTATSGSKGTKIGVRGSVTGAYGNNYGGYFQATGDTNALAVVGLAQVVTHRTLTSVYQRTNAGGVFSSNDGQGIFASAIGSYNIGNTKACTGITSVANDNSGAYNSGVTGYGLGGSAVTTGVLAYADQGGSSPSYVIGVNSNVTGSGSVGTFAGYFDGDVTTTGNLSKAGGSFKIDHPLDPANKYLIHSFVESPDMMNIYNGNITTDANGTAVVSLPTYFMAENKEFRYQLTVIGSFAQAIVFEEVKDNQFVIKTNQPNIKVSWQVTGIRQDAWANANRIKDEVEKKGEEKGRYIHPELFGKPKSMSISSLTRVPSQPAAESNYNIFELLKLESTKPLIKL
ncbi:MAG: hypothetical protein HYZ54_11765 [Ignavibacteriae bacterium]|nr:hypothetical protein [Ignavibacteriota bacterium]